MVTDKNEETNCLKPNFQNLFQISLDTCHINQKLHFSMQNNNNLSLSPITTHNIVKKFWESRETLVSVGQGRKTSGELARSIIWNPISSLLQSKRRKQTHNDQ